MKSNIHFVILVIGSILSVAAAYIFIQLPSIPSEFVSTPDMDAHIFQAAKEGMIASMQNGYLIAVSARILLAYLGFVTLVFGHYHFMWKHKSVSA